MTHTEAPLDQIGTQLFATMPFSTKLGIEVLEHSKDLVRTRLPWHESLCTLGNTIHGGALMSLADSTAAVCAFLNLPEGSRATTTVESKTNFLRAIRSGHATATSRPLHTGRKFIIIETEIHDATAKLAAKVTQTQAVL